MLPFLQRYGHTIVLRLAICINLECQFKVNLSLFSGAFCASLPGYPVRARAVRQNISSSPA